MLESQQGLDLIEEDLIEAPKNKKFEKATCEHVEMEASDHCLLILNTNPQKRKVKRRFYFDQRWAKDKESDTVIKRAWGVEQHRSRMFRVVKRIKKCRLVLIEWNKRVKANTKVKIQEIKEKLKVAREEGDPCNSGDIASLKRQLSKTYKDEELFWSQKSRSRWLKERDKNTTFFHISVNEAKIKQALFSVFPNKAPGVDGISPLFFQNYWNIIKDDVVNAISSFFHTGLSNLIKKTVEGNALTGIKIYKDSPMVSQLSFADDSLLCYKASKQEALKVKEILQQYGQALGQVINFDKSAMFFSRNTPNQTRVVISEALDSMREAHSEKYLGLLMTIRRAKNQAFGYLKSKINKGGNGRLLCLQKWFSAQDVEYITSIPLSLYRRNDRLYWKHSKSSMYTMKSGYAAAKLEDASQSRRLEPGSETSWEVRKHIVWKRLWSLNLKMKLKHFLWRCLQNSLLVNEAIYKRIGKGSSLCSCCGEDTETIEHICFFCPKAQMVWKIAPVSWEGITEPQSNIQRWWDAVMQSAKKEQGLDRIKLTVMTALEAIGGGGTEEEGPAVSLADLRVEEDPTRTDLIHKLHVKSQMEIVVMQIKNPQLDCQGIPKQCNSIQPTSNVATGFSIAFKNKSQQSMLQTISARERIEGYLYTDDYTK
ncbi:uncharacterized protein [Coffea arabica]|uniref:Reverse transcriptase zinc-binding domain-containing protein n=1 Tax=Coffea arabica TaxID=13443 RepID=A0ABM4UFA4_COFAR